MALHTVGIGECSVSREPEDVIVTHALGSCVAVLIHDPVAHVAGLLHYVLPDSTIDREKALTRPFAFADTGIPMLFQEAYKLGAVKSRLQVMAVGGAQMLEAGGTLHIGRRNVLSMKKIFLQAGVKVHMEKLGGSASRTVRLEVGTGVVRLRIAGEREQVIHLAPQRIGAVDGL